MTLKENASSLSRNVLFSRVSFYSRCSKFATVNSLLRRFVLFTHRRMAIKWSEINDETCIILASNKMLLHDLNFILLKKMCYKVR